MNHYTQIFRQWIERRIEVRALKGAHFDRVWSFRWACSVVAIYFLPLYLLFWAMLAVLTAIFVPDRDLPTVVGSMIRIHGEMLRWDNFMFYVYIISIATQCVALYLEVECAKPRVFRRLGCCTQCGYPLTNLEQPVCTECGKQVERLAEK